MDLFLESVASAVLQLLLLLFVHLLAERDRIFFAKACAISALQAPPVPSILYSSAYVMVYRMKVHIMT